MENVIEKQVMRKIFWRLVPMLMLMYVVSYIDRINVGFAALTMNKDLGLSATAYGWGAGIFFIGYCLFEVPSNLMLVKVGARRWIARILATWGILSCGMAFIQGPNSFLVMRFLLGQSSRLCWSKDERKKLAVQPQIQGSPSRSTSTTCKALAGLRDRIPKSAFPVTPR